MVIETAALKDLLLDTRDGDWGTDNPESQSVCYRIIRGTDFSRARVGALSSVPVRYITRDSASRRTLQNDDILIETAGGSRDRPTGRTLLITNRLLTSSRLPLTCASFCRFLRVNRALAEPAYVYWYLQHMYATGYMWQHQVQHTGLARFQYTRFASSTHIPLPSRLEQQAIAHILGTLDDKIELNQRMNKTLEAMARALFKSWFVDFDPVRAKAEGRQPVGMDAETAALFPDGFEESELGEIPRGWQVCDLDTVIEINERSITAAYPHAIIDYIDIASVREGTLTTPTTYMLSEAPSRARRLVQDGDTIWSMVRPNLKAYLFIHKPVSNLVVSTGFAVLTPRDIPPSYLYAWTTTDSFVEYLTSHADGSAYPAVRADVFARASVLVPSQPILAAFEKLVGPIRTKASHNYRESESLAAIRDALLPKLLSGEIRVQDVETVVEEVIA